MRPSSLRHIFLFACVLLIQQLNAQFFYGLHQQFGKNRVQFDDFNWTYLRYERYDVYFYKQGKPFAEQVSRMVDRMMPQVEHSLDVVFDERIQILVFNSLSDLKQSNLNDDSEDAYNTGGVNHSAGSRMFVYFDGDYAGLERQVREGLSGLALSNLMYGGFVSSIKNSTLLTLPDWYVDGLLAYLAGDDKEIMQAHVMDGLKSGKYKHFNALTGDEARLAGYSIWYYIAETYGRGVLKNVVFMTVNQRSVDKGMEYVLGADLNQVMVGWRSFFLAREEMISGRGGDIGVEIIKAKNHEVIDALKISKDGNQIAYVANRLGEYRLYIYDVANDKRRKIYRGGYKIAQNTDHSYPILAWHPNGKILAFITEEKGFIWLNYYNVETKELDQKKLFGFQKVLSFSYSNDGKQFLMSAVKNGRTDIFLYTILSTSIENITNDDWTDLNPTFAYNEKLIVFSSNRIDDTLRTEEKVYRHPDQFDLFAYRTYDAKNPTLWRFTQTADIDETNPMAYSLAGVSFLSEENGIVREDLIEVDSSIAYIDTATHYRYNFNRYILNGPVKIPLHQDVSVDGGRIVRVIVDDKRYRITSGELMSSKTRIKESIKKEEPIEKPNVNPNFEVVVKENNEKEVDIHNYEFDPSLTNGYQGAPRRSATPTKVPEKNEPIAIIPKVDPFKKDTAQYKLDSEFNIPVARNYFYSLYQDDFTIQVDNVFDYPQYQPYTGTPNAGLINTGFNALFKVGVVDLLNDYRIILGFRTDFQPVFGLSLAPNSDLQIAVQDKKSRLDKTYNFYRRSQLSLIDNFYSGRYLTYEGRINWSYPLSPVTSFRWSTAWRNMRRIVLADNQTAIQIPDLTTDYGIVSASYVYDNTRKQGVNLYHGLRFKIFTEYYRNFSKSNSGMHTLGADFRNYTPVHRQIIWANRLAIGTSFGQELLMHYLGGVDNQFSPQFYDNTAYNSSGNYAFQTVATNMRGFYQNVRNGSSFTVFNSELRVPIIRYLLNRPIQSSFLRDFQIVGFFDAGTAWNGLNPYGSENALNNQVIENGPITIIVDKQKDPFVAGYGFGLRTSILGYFCRADWAWGIEDGVILPNVFYFSLSTDF